MQMYVGGQINGFFMSCVIVLDKGDIFSLHTKVKPMLVRRQGRKSIWAQ